MNCCISHSPESQSEERVENFIRCPGALRSVALVTPGKKALGIQRKVSNLVCIKITRGNSQMKFSRFMSFWARVAASEF